MHFFTSWGWVWYVVLGEEVSQDGNYTSCDGEVLPVQAFGPCGTAVELTAGMVERVLPGWHPGQCAPSEAPATGTPETPWAFAKRTGRLATTPEGWDYLAF